MSIREKYWKESIAYEASLDEEFNSDMRLAYMEGFEDGAKLNLWKPIKEAPHNGHKVDIFYKGQRYVNAWYENNLWNFVVENRICVAEEKDVTHYTLIPENPI